MKRVGHINLRGKEFGFFKFNFFVSIFAPGFGDLLLYAQAASKHLSFSGQSDLLWLGRACVFMHYAAIYFQQLYLRHFHRSKPGKSGPEEMFSGCIHRYQPGAVRTF